MKQPDTIFLGYIGENIFIMIISIGSGESDMHVGKETEVIFLEGTWQYIIKDKTSVLKRSLTQNNVYDLIPLIYRKFKNSKTHVSVTGLYGITLAVG